MPLFPGSNRVSHVHLSGFDAVNPIPGRNSGGLLVGSLTSTVEIDAGERKIVSKRVLPVSGQTMQRTTSYPRVVSSRPGKSQQLQITTS